MWIVPFHKGIRTTTCRFFRGNDVNNTAFTTISMGEAGLTFVSFESVTECWSHHCCLDESDLLLMRDEYGLIEFED